MLSRATLRRSLYLAGAAATSAGFLTSQEHERDQKKSQSYSYSCRLALFQQPLSIMARPAAFCDAKKGSLASEYHAIPLPSDDAVKTQELVKRYKIYITGNLDEVCKFKKEKNGVKIYTIKEVSKRDHTKESIYPYGHDHSLIVVSRSSASLVQGAIPDPSGQTGLPVARVGEAVIGAPADQVASLWWVFNARTDWDAKNTLASEVVEEYGPHTRLVYIKGSPKPMISSRDFAFVSHK